MQLAETTSDSVPGGGESVHSPSIIGSVLGARYRVLRKLGAGAMGDVYVAQHELLGCEVAVKVLSSSLRESRLARQRFKREAELGATLHHPHLVRVLDFEPAGKTPYFVMELLAGTDLRSLLGLCGRLEIERAVPLVRGALNGLSSAHACGIVHRDLKPANLFVVVEGATESCKVLDFGVAKRRGHAGLWLDPLTLSDRPLGTLAYMAPEQIREPKEVDARADLYSVAAILLEAISGRRLFEAESAAEQMFLVLNKRPPRLDALVETCPVGLADVLERALSRERADRYGSAAELAAALEPYATAASALSPTAVTKRRAPAPLLVGVGVVLGVAMAYGMGALTRPQASAYRAVAGSERAAIKREVPPQPVAQTAPEGLPVGSPGDGNVATPASNHPARASTVASARHALTAVSAAPTVAAPSPEQEPAADARLGVERRNPYQ